MTHYTLKKSPQTGLFLLNEAGEQQSVKDLLSLHPDCSVYAFDAPMGAGKTTLIKQLCEELGTSDVVNSPTFSIVNVYEYGGGEIYHFDCYRLKDIEEAQDFGAEDYLYSGQLCLIEWPDLIAPLLDDKTIYIRIRVQEDGSRLLEID